MPQKVTQENLHLFIDDGHKTLIRTECYLSGGVCICARIWVLLFLLASGQHAKCEHRCYEDYEC